MPRIHVLLRRVGPGAPYFRPEDRSGTVHRIPMYRLYLKLVVAPLDSTEPYQPFEITEARRPEAILDTGAPLSIFPHVVWATFEDAIQWLVQPPAAARRVTVLGGTWSCRLGRFRVGVVDEDGRTLPPVMVNAFFLEPDPNAPSEAVVGLRSRLLDNRRLRQEDAPSGGLDQAWWLEDA